MAKKVASKDFNQYTYGNRRGRSRVSFYLYGDGCTVVIENKRKAYYYAFSLTREEVKFYESVYSRCDNGCSAFALFRFLGRLRRPFKREVIPVVE